VDDRLTPAPIVVRFAEAVKPIAGVRAFYVHGSLASGHFRPGVSDLDLVAMVEREVDADQQVKLVDLHTETMRKCADAADLHCAYVPCDNADDIAEEHIVWAHRELYRRPLSGIARAELHQFGITVYGPPPAELLPVMDAAAVRAAARTELTGYWTKVTRKSEPWLQDVFVDHGLISLARARATITTGMLITKDEAIEALDELRVPPWLIRHIRRRRLGEEITLNAEERIRQARISRRIMMENIDRIAELAIPPVCPATHRPADVME
jgi:predicted nucleotidyltransferase